MITNVRNTTKEVRSIAVAIVMALVVVTLVATQSTATPPGDNLNSEDYWEDYFPGAIECYKHTGSNSHGYLAGGNKLVILNPYQASWPGDQFVGLVVKGGDDRTVVTNPTVGQGYSAPLNNGGQVPTVSHWIVCKGEAPTTPPFDWNWKYPAPTCEYLEVTYPDAIPAGQANDVNIRIVVDGQEHTLNFHKNEGTWSGTKKFYYADHASWEGWTNFTVVWTQVGGTNYHWQGEVTCGSTPTPTPSSSESPSVTPTPAPSVTPSATPTPSVTPSATPTPTPTPSVTPSATPTPSVTPSATPTPTPTPSVTPSATPTPTPSVTPSPSSTPTPTPSSSELPTATPSPTPTPSSTPTPSPSSSELPTATPAPSPSASEEPTATPSPSATPSPTAPPTTPPEEEDDIDFTDVLADTGSNAMWMVTLAVVFLAAGAAVTGIRRREEI